MIDEQLIRDIEEALNALKAGDAGAADRLAARLGAGSITVGDVSSSTAVAVGSHIRIVVRQQTLPEPLVARLNALADALDRRAEAVPWPHGHVRVFLASPSDVADERQLAMRAIGRVQNDPLYKDRVTLEAVAWDRPDTSVPMLAAVDPQTAISQGLARPSECDIVAVMLWSRMGTPLDLARYRKADGSQYLSGTEWEYEDAMASARETGRPLLVVYRRSEMPRVDLDDPGLEEKRTQRARVKAFFAGFANPDGSIRQSYNPYGTPSEFEDLFEHHLRSLVARLISADLPAPPTSRTTGTATPVPPLDWPAGVSPFPGLRAFGPAEAPVYFGRGAECDALVRHLGDPKCRCVAVVGASGSGKSSLVGAGLIPRLAANAVPGSRDWPVVRFAPDQLGTGDPYASLAAALANEPLRLATPRLAAHVKASPGALAALLAERLATMPDWAEVVLFVDQFEELFTRVDDPGMRAAFVAALVEAARALRVRTIVTIRADFYHRVAELPALAALLNAQENRTFPLSAPGPIELYEMITQPARVAGLRFEDGLARQMLAETGAEPGALALMAYALQQLYERSSADDCRLTWHAYHDFGGVLDAIGAQAQRACDALDREARDALPAVFRELVEVDEAGTATRKRAPLSAVACDAAAQRLVAALTDARLLVQSGRKNDAEAKEPAEAMVEVAHEALFRNWPRLTDWIKEAQDDLILLRQVRAATQLWVGKKFDQEFLWPDGRLKPVRAMRDRLSPRLSDVEQDFIRPEAERLLPELDDIATPHARRSWIGERLCTIGDPRAGVGLVRTPLPPLSEAETRQGAMRLWGEEQAGLPDIVWLPVTGGRIKIEGKTFKVQPFFMAKYPITYVQFRAFREAADGWRDGRWWKELAGDDDERAEPEAQRFKFDNHPAETLSWYAAVAFGHWLNHRLGWPEPGDRLDRPGIRLPAEWEWQWAAGAGSQQRDYPWGPDWDGRRANTTESGLGRTTAVGMYPAGAAACGALDMGGNVDEWCLNQHEHPERVGLEGYAARMLRGIAARVLRGGSFNGGHHGARVSERRGDSPNPFSYRAAGFRVVVVPVSSS